MLFVYTVIIGIFGIGTKYASEKNYTFYIDSVTIKLKDNDEVAPVITYTGKTDILTSAEKEFKPNISAFDAQEGRDIPLSYEWSGDALDEQGRMIAKNNGTTIFIGFYFIRNLRSNVNYWRL